jgi:hypothetical protein
MKFWAEKKVVFRQHNTTLKWLFICLSLSFPFPLTYGLPVRIF